MKIGMIADTHDNLTAIRKAVEILNEKGIDLLIHAGDFVSPFTVEPLKLLNAPLVGVFGNNDGDKVLLKQKYSEKGIGELFEDPYEFEYAALRILVTHKPAIVNPVAASGLYDLVVFGHTHKAALEQRRGQVRDTSVWVINPGECCGYLTGRETVAVLEVERSVAELLTL
jgi:putative phosphoesterase